MALVGMALVGMALVGPVLTRVDAGAALLVPVGMLVVATALARRLPGAARRSRAVVESAAG